MSMILISENEIFKNIRDENENDSIYKISNYGRVYDTEKNKFLNVSYIKYTYYKNKRYELHKKRPCVNIKLNGKYKRLLVSRLVMITFHPIENCELLEVDHLDGNPLNNYISNLEWVTHEENIRRSVINHLHPYGENHHNSKYSDELIHSICNDICLGLSRKEIKEKYSVNGQLIDDIKSGRSHVFISSMYVDKGFRYKKISKKYKKERIKKINKICKLIDEGFTNSEIFIILNLPENEKCLPNDIRKHRIYNYISKDYNF